MTTVQRGLVALVVGLVIVPAGSGAGAVEADATLRVEKQGWYWRHAEQTRVEAEPPECPPPDSGVPCPNVTQQPNPIESDHFATGYSGGQSEAERPQAIAAFQFDLTWMVPDTEVSRAELVLEESNDDATHRNRRPGGTVAPDAPGTTLRACLVKEFWGPSQPGLWRELPEIDCAAASAPGEREETVRDGEQIPLWRFDITQIAKLWGADPFANFGLAIVPAPDAAGDFQVSFHGDTRIVTADPVTRREQVESLRRVQATMRFDAPATSLPGRAGDRMTGGVDGAAASALAAPILGSPVASFGRTTLDAGLDEQDVNRSVAVQRGPGRILVRSVQTPAYTWIGLPIAFLLARAFVRLFASGDRQRRVNRVAAAYRRTTAGVSA